MQETVVHGAVIGFWLFLILWLVEREQRQRLEKQLADCRRVNQNLRGLVTELGGEQYLRG